MGLDTKLDDNSENSEEEFSEEELSKIIFISLSAVVCAVAVYIPYQVLKVAWLTFIKTPDFVFSKTSLGVLFVVFTVMDFTVRNYVAFSNWLYSKTVEKWNGEE